jgi:hypothetical protein
MTTGRVYLRPHRPTQTPVQNRGRTRLLALALTGAAHVAVLTALFWPHPAPLLPPKPTLAPLQVTLLPTPPAPPDPLKLAPSDFQNELQPAAPKVAMPVLTITKTATPNTSDLLSASQIAGAASVGEGGGGGGGSCNMAQAVQRALRRDPLVQNAVEDSNRLGKAIMVWNGDWVRTGGQEGKGLSAVREAIMWQVAFAPEACRNERVHGMLLLSLADGSTRFAVGAGEWRWSDLLGVRGQ